MSGAGDIDVESLIDAARSAGTADPEHEIAALQDLLRVVWGLMSERQQAELLESNEAQTLLAAERDEVDETGEE